MNPSPQFTLVLPPNLVVYCDEKIVGSNLKRLAAQIPNKPAEKRPPGEPLPRGIRRTDRIW